MTDQSLHLDATESVTVVPPASGFLVALTDKPLTPAQVQFRDEIGLPAAGPIVMSGHQAEIWHPGIAAKWFAMTTLARRFGARPAWVVVDQDDNDPSRIKYPTASLGRLTLGASRPAMPTCARPAETLPKDVPEDCAPAAREGLEHLLRAVNAHANATTLAEQYTNAACDLLGSHAQGVTLVYATRLRQTTLFRAFVRSMRDDSTAVRLYNRAVQETGGAGGVRPLRSDSTRGDELPLWHVHPSGARLPVYARDAAQPGEVLTPKALVLTALLRLAGCELFIHGLGGGVYDRVTDRWLELLANEAATRPLVAGAPPAPTCVVSATKYLPLDGPDVPSPGAIAHASWLAHRAKHDPLVLGDRVAAAQRSLLLRGVTGAPSKRERFAAFLALHKFLSEYRASHAADLAASDASVAAAGASRRAAGVRFDRTWAFPLYGPTSLEGLHAEVARTLQQ